MGRTIAFGIGQASVTSLQRNEVTHGAATRLFDGTPTADISARTRRRPRDPSWPVLGTGGLDPPPAAHRRRTTHAANPRSRQSAFPCLAQTIAWTVAP